MAVPMNSGERFRAVMSGGKADRVPFFEEGIREEVVARWQAEGLPAGADVAGHFNLDRRDEVALESGPRPALSHWPRVPDDLRELRASLIPDSRPEVRDVAGLLAVGGDAGATTMLRPYHGFFLTLGVGDWARFLEVIYQVADNPRLVGDMMRLFGEFAAVLTDRALANCRPDAVLFSEPIGGNSGPLLSPATFRDLVLPAYDPILEVVRRHGVPTVILRTYSNARSLLPDLVARGVNCLWACDVSTEAMDYRNLRREFGSDLGLLGGIDVSVLRRDPRAIRRAVEATVPPLLASGRYIPFISGRIRADVSYGNYAAYRRILETVIARCTAGN